MKLLYYILLAKLLYWVLVGHIGKEGWCTKQLRDDRVIVFLLSFQTEIIILPLFLSALWLYPYFLKLKTEFAPTPWKYVTVSNELKVDKIFLVKVKKKWKEKNERRSIPHIPA